MKAREQYNTNINKTLLNNCCKSQNIGIFYLIFEEHLNELHCYISGFGPKNHHEILVIQTNPFTHRQPDIKTVSTKNSDKNIHSKCLFREVKIGQ